MGHLVGSLRPRVIIVAGVDGFRTHNLLGDVREVVMSLLLAGLTQLLDVALLRWRLLYSLSVHLVHQLLARAVRLWHLHVTLVLLAVNRGRIWILTHSRKWVLSIQ
jgi:hypothetical protein